jgi:hypothetical protein
MSDQKNPNEDEEVDHVSGGIVGTHPINPPIAPPTHPGKWLPPEQFSTPE